MTADNKRRHARYTVEGAGINVKTIFSTEAENNDISIGGAPALLHYPCIIRSFYFNPSTSCIS